MSKTILFDFVVDKENNKIKVDREFNAPIDLVWAAWTDPAIKDLWWAPKPWQAVTVSDDFREGGRWHYYMQGPEGERHYCLFDYEKIEVQKSYSGADAFCDENAVINTTHPRTNWANTFEDKQDRTIVHVEITYESLEDLETIISMGFKEGFTMGMENLDEYIKAQFYLRRDKKPDNTARVCSYLNFPGNTEEAMNFYKSVFKTEFVNGIQRLGDAPTSPEHPPLADNVKDMVLHVELPLIGGHILMATDAPKEMGFTVTAGNNMHIYLETESREKTKRIFDALSEDGVVEIELQDMFFGAYYGNFQDKYGINWMVSHVEK